MAFVFISLGVAQLREKSSDVEANFLAQIRLNCVTSTPILTQMPILPKF